MILNPMICWKRLASSASVLLLLACAQNSGGGDGASCAISQNVSVAFQQVNAKMELKSAGQQYQLLVKLTDMDRDLIDLKNSLSQVMQSADLKIKKLTSQTALVEFPNTVAAKDVVERFIQDGKISQLEEDQKTFAFDDGEEAISEATALTPSSALTAPQTTDPNAREVIVAVIDTGVDYTHKDLKDFMWTNSAEIAGNGIDDDHNGYVDDVNGWDFVNEDNQPMADDTRSYHGTHVAGIIKQAALQAGSAGIRLKIMPLKYLDSTSTGRTSNAIRAIDYAIKKGAVIMNNSWGSFGASSALNEAIERARQAHILFMAASGNGDANGNGVNIDQTSFYPASFQHENIISVAATTKTGSLAAWSNYGGRSVDLAAPGTSILSTRNGNAYASLTGTSMATPYVSGVAAMLWAQRPDLSVNEIRKIIFGSVSSGSSFSGKVMTGGAINPTTARQVAASYQHDPNDNGTISQFASQCY